MGTKQKFRKKVDLKPTICFGHYCYTCQQCRGCLVVESCLAEKVGDSHIIRF